jgi:hypothetical protein
VRDCREGSPGEFQDSRVGRGEAEFPRGRFPTKRPSFLGADFQQRGDFLRLISSGG